ncbi:MAG: HDOD domain-containing protein [Desulfobacterales bacterium]|jgi:putative nucleotidyltransferase with HDIG domain
MFNIEKRVIASGSYYAGMRESVVLQAFLGTCVGVAIYDSDANAGGLIHLLLPKPVISESTYEPEKYALTALPTFLKALYNHGAEKGKLKASIAGGALISPFTEQDLRFDIGGLTLEIVKQILADEDIEIEKSETGGFFTSKLSLDMRNWKCTIEPSIYDNFPKDSKLNRPDLKNIGRVMEHIQPIPQVVIKILRMIGEDAYDFKDIANEIRNDQVICARTLKVCNSALYAKSKKIDSIDHALVFLGQELFAKLVISSYIKDLLQHYNQGYSLCMGGIYHHAIGTAIITEKLARLTQRISASLAYTTGLLHDIGKVVLDQYIGPVLPLFYRELQNKVDSLKLEKKHLGVNHTEVGSQLAEKWSFPEPLVDTILYHHYPENATQHPELTHMVYIADFLMSRFHVGLELEHINTDKFISRFEKIGLSVSQFQDIVDLIPANISESSP